MFMKIEDTIINLTEIQSVKPSRNSIEVTFINGKTVNINTHKYDYIISGPGRITNAMYDEYNECIEKWQDITIKAIYTSLTLRG